MGRNVTKVLRAMGRDIMAEKAATMFRKGHHQSEVSAALGLSDSALRQLSRDYGFRFPTVQFKHWPAADEPGDSSKGPSAYANWQRAVIGAAATRRFLANAGR